MNSLCRRLALLSALSVLNCQHAGRAAEADQKVIRLRTELIPTSPMPAVSRQAVAIEFSGLYLIQLNDPITQEQRDELQSRGVVIHRYVPDDAFVVSAPDTALAAIRNLAYVRWLGPFRPEHKLHPALAGVRGVSRVRVLLSPAASAVELAHARRMFRQSGLPSRSRFGSILQGEADAARLRALMESKVVLWIEPAAKMRLFDEVSTKIVAGDEGGPGTPTTMQQLGFDGSGVTVAVADSGLQNGEAAGMHPDLAGRADVFFFYGSLTDAADEHSHGTHVTGIIAGDGAVGETDENGYLYGLGVAPGVRIVTQRLFDGLGGYEAPPSFEALTRDAVRSGAEIGSNSWGDDTQGRYDLSAAEFDALVRDADAVTPGAQPYILEFSAGNAGPGSQTIGSPAVAKNVIASGATENDREEFFIYGNGADVMADFSSRGPCEDGRIKPDVVAPGTWIASLKSASATDENAWSPISAFYMYQGGTSQSGPHVSGAAAVFVQYYRETHTNATPSPALVKAALINSAVDMDDEFGGTEPIPNNDEGWGRIDLTEVIGSDRRLDFVDQATVLRTGETYEHRVVVAGSDLPLKITLAYTDVPGFPAAIPALVNDLDLEVVGPDERIYRGNQFINGESIPGVAGADRINNVEAVHLAAPLPGEYLVRVRARNVVEDARIDTPGIDQDFALVVSGDLPLPGVGVLFFDRAAVAAPASLGLRLIDFDLAGRPSVAVRVRSSTEPAGEEVTLFSLGSAGVFTNRIATVTGAAQADGRLQVSHGDTVEASYADEAPAAERTAVAVADLEAPLITNVRATNQLGRVFVRWNTDEPAQGIVRFGTNGALSMAVTNSLPDTAQELALQDLERGATYQFLVVAVDAAGNASTNDNGGGLFSFVVAPASSVLLVNAYTPADPLFGTIEIPLTSYTDSLDQTGLTYDVWEVAERGSPGTNDLHPFKAVIWRYNDNPLSADTLSSTDQNTLRSYVESGGGLFISGMELLTRIWTGSPDAVGNAFITNVLQVQAFEIDPGVPSAEGIHGDPVSGGAAFDLDYEVFDSDLLQLIGQSPDVSDTLTLGTNAIPIFTEADGGEIAGLRQPRTGDDRSGRVVFLSFPLDAVSDTAPSPNNRAGLLRNILQYLAPGESGLGTVFLDRPAYTLPSAIVVEAGDSDLKGQGAAAVTLYSDTQTNGVRLDLVETARAGLFRGFIALEHPTNAAAAPGSLRAVEGDLIRVVYEDASTGRTLESTAVVDTLPPGIQDVEVVPEYESATFTWTTNERTDALVQFGESPRFDRTGYEANLKFDHTVTLIGLRPDRVYYYRVVSRDAAGNAAVDENAAAPYSFRTLKPVLPPWVDDLDSGATNWSIFDSEESGLSWTLGVPANNWELEAHSPPNAWGSSLTGIFADWADTFLISPAIDLTGGNVASLRFWHSYDFQERTDLDLIEGGELLLIIDNQVVPIDVFFDANGGWEEAEYNLTPYVGRVIFLVWHHQLLSLEAAPRSGWLVDDISVTVSNAVLGTLVITNNLSQAGFVVSGPVSKAGEGWSATYTNLPLGEYVVTFAAVPSYETPPPRTNLLNSAGPVEVQGIYTFVDTNTNSMPDVWEQQVFGEVSPSRNATTDTDQDGRTDYEEFIAGTDATNAGSVFRTPLPQPLPGDVIRFDWASVRGRAYRLMASQNLADWSPVSAWIRAASGTASITVPAGDDGTRFYRLEVRP